MPKRNLYISSVLIYALVTTISISLAFCLHFLLKLPGNYSSAMLSLKIPYSTITIYSKWRVKYGIVHPNPSSYLFRLYQFQKTFITIKTLRKMNPQTNFVLNKFSHLTPSEIRSLLISTPPSKDGDSILHTINKDSRHNPVKVAIVEPIRIVPQQKEQIQIVNTDINTTDIPKGIPVDYEPLIIKGSALQQEIKFLRSLGVPTEYRVPHQRPIFNQLSCNSCWAFTSKHVIQDHLHGLVEVSPQQIINCQLKEDQPCKGGALEYGLEYSQQNGYAIDSEVPYTQKREKCDPSKLHKLQKRAFRYRPTDRKQLVRLLHQGKYGVAMRLNIDDPSLVYYKSGVYSTDKASCRSKISNHAVTLHGYGPGYWWIRNSWGEEWGRKGYMKVQMNQDGLSRPGLCFCGGEIGSTHCAIAGLV